MLSRRFFLGGLLAAPAVVAVGNLMPLRGIKFDPLVRMQSWPIGQNIEGPFWVQEGPLSLMGEVRRAMTEIFGAFHYAEVERRNVDMCSDLPEARSPDAPLIGAYDAKEEWFGGGGVFRIGVAHGVTRVDPPKISEAEFRKQVAQRAKRWCDNLRGDPEAMEYRMGAHAKWTAAMSARHQASTEALIAQKIRLHTWGHPDANRILREAGYVI